jgi:hypothetical protein
MISKTNILTGAMVALLIGGMLAATPASAWTRYHNNNTGAVVGAAISGMALGTANSAPASQNRYYDNGYYAPPPPPPGYGYAPAYGYDGY